MKKYRNFSVVLYTEPDVTRLSAQRWAYIYHDRDIESDGTLKKPHWHLLLEFVNPRSISSVSKMCGVAENLVEVVYSVEGSRLYLTHANAPDKTQYEIGEVKANYDLENIDKPLSFLALYNMVESCENFKDFLEKVSAYSISQSLNNYSLLCNIWKSHPF